MSKPKRQHFIPRSYLNNFAERSGKKAFIHGSMKNENQIVRLSTKDVCLRTDLYTIPTSDETKKYAIEHFYADKIDSVFPEIYQVLTNDDVDLIDFETRLKIVNTALSLYFRTPKFLNEQNQMIEVMYHDLSKMSPGDTVSYRFLGEEISFNKGELDTIIKEKKENNRQLFLSQHLRAYEKLVQLKLLDGIMVHKIVDDSELITSDNPVIIRPYMDPRDSDFDYGILNERVDPFDVKNMIHLPLDNKYIMTIMPRMEETIVNQIQRLEIDKIHSLMYNSDIEKFSETWLLGTEDGLKNHFADQKQYNKETPENIQYFDDFKEMVLENAELAEIMEKYGIDHEKTIAKIEAMKKNPKVLSDPNFMDLVARIEAAIADKKKSGN